MPSADVLIEVVAGVGRLTLNRPGAINALTPGMCETLLATLHAWRDDDEVASVELRGAGTRGLCSGADVRGLREIVLAGGDAVEFFRTEYALNALIATYPKPYTAHMAGVVMGGGLGLSAHGSRRLVRTDSALAMPETNIGFFPDVGMLHLLARAPGELGTSLALAGTTVGAADAMLVGLADDCAGEFGPGHLAAARSWIDAGYAGNDPVAILRRLETSGAPAARAAAADLRARCPLSVCVTLEAIRRAATMATVAEVLVMDLRLAARLVVGRDFLEGVRAQLVDKDRQPAWGHARIEDVPRDEVLACFE